MPIRSKRRVPSTENQTTNNEILRKTPAGSCKCEPEAACQYYDDIQDYRCVCTHSGLVINKDQKCERVTVPPFESAKITVVPQKNSLSSVSNSSHSISEDNWKGNIREAHYTPIAYIAIVSVFVLVFLMTLSYYIYARVRNKRAAARALMLKKNLFRNDRFISNPQYSIVHTEREASLVQFPNEMVATINRSSIDELEEIGEGFFGKVYRGLLHTVNNEVENVKTVAIKTLKGLAAPEIEQDFMREVEVMSSFHHPNILTLLGVCLRENNNPPWMIFEYMPYGDLTNVLRNGNNEMHKTVPAMPTLTQATLLSIVMQIAEGMEYLASQHFVHRDLACRNCLVGSNLVVKIADFGMSRDVYTSDYYRIGGTRMLPVRWMSPESILFGKFTLESDIWSYGVVLWEVYNYGKQPYFGHTNEQVLQLILDRVLLEMPKNCPLDVVDITTGCWKIDPKERPCFLDICNTLSRLLLEVNGDNSTILPRPPQQPVTVNMPKIKDDQQQDLVIETEDNVDILSEDLLDDENYLKPNAPPPKHP